MRALSFLIIIFLNVNNVRSLFGGDNGVTSEICWNHGDMCVVQATLHQAPTNGTKLSMPPLDIHCFEDSNSEETKARQFDTTTAAEAATSGVSTSMPQVAAAMPTSTSTSTLTSTSMSTPAAPSAPILQAPSYLLRFFERAHAITLNGCHTSFDSTFALEFLPKCDKIAEIIIERFHGDVLQPLRCPSATFMQLETLRFQRNEFATITSQSLANLALLRALYLQRNSLRRIERFAFDNLHFLERLQIEDEPLLDIKEYDLLQHSSLLQIKVINVKRIIPKLFQHLPKDLRELYVENTALNERKDDSISDSSQLWNGDSLDVSMEIRNVPMLHNISIINCNLTEFALYDRNGSIEFLNLSGNALEDFQFHVSREVMPTMNAMDEDQIEIIAALKILDLSFNKLSTLPVNWLTDLPQLQVLKVNNNLLKTLPLAPFLNSLPGIQFIDFSHNNLIAFRSAAEPIDCERIRLRIDKNPWNCMWLLDFTHHHPEKFRIFQYEKFLSQINVNGLECVPEETMPLGMLNEQQRTLNEPLTNPTARPSKTYNVSTYTLVYGNPYDSKPRSQRSNALIIVFMLPVGIAVLFVLLYLWIYCQKMFHMSYYRTNRFFACCARKNADIVTTPSPQNRFDIVRRLPPTQQQQSQQQPFTQIANGTLRHLDDLNENYEMPLNGVLSACNCVNKHSQNHDGTHMLCEKHHHITYVPLPAEKPQTVYEEIIECELRDNMTVDAQSARNSTLYDHLRFD